MRQASVRGSVSVAALGAIALVAACSSSSSPGATATSASITTQAPSTSADAATTSTTAPAAPGARWTTYYGDNARDGVSTDGPSAAAKLRQQWTSAMLDGSVYAQPLLVGDRAIIATENDTVYSLALTDGHIVWQRHLGTPVPQSALPCGNVDPLGITGTPVVDVSARRIYAVGMVQPIHHELFALDLDSGRVIASTRVDVPGSDPTVQNQRGALSLAGGTVYVPYGGRFGDCGDYHGRIESVAVTSTGLGAQRSYTLPTQREGGFWSPPGLAIASDGTLYVASGNSSSSGTYDYGNTVVRLSPTLRLLDSFAPTNWAALNAGDVDIGSTSPALLTGGQLLQIGKSGRGYLLRTAHLGGIGGERTSRTICPGQSFGGVAHRATTVYVPCGDGVVQVVAGDGTLSIGWTASVAAPGPAVLEGNRMWTVDTADGTLDAFDVSTGKQVFSVGIGEAPSRFTSPAVGDGRVVVAAARRVHAVGA
jgi:hypothetical protein